MDEIVLVTHDNMVSIASMLPLSEVIVTGLSEEKKEQAANDPGNGTLILMEK